MSKSRVISVAFVGYKKIDFSYPETIEYSMDINPPYQSLQYLLNQIEKGKSIDILFLCYENIEEQDLSFLHRIKYLDSKIKFIIEYSGYIPHTTLMNLFSVEIYPLLYNNTMPNMNYSFYIQAVQNKIIMMPDEMLIGLFNLNQMMENNGYKKNEHNLSDVEIQILMLLSRGKSYEEVAVNLNMKLDTFRYHIKKLYKKLNIHNKSKATAYYYMNLRPPIDNLLKSA